MSYSDDNCNNYRICIGILQCDSPGIEPIEACSPRFIFNLKTNRWLYFEHVYEFLIYQLID